MQISYRDVIESLMNLYRVASWSNSLEIDQPNYVYFILWNFQISTIWHSICIKNIIRIYHVEFSFWIFSSAIVHINRISKKYPQILSIQGRSLNFSRGASFSQKRIYPPNVIQSLSIQKYNNLKFTEITFMIQRSGPCFISIHNIFNS